LRATTESQRLPESVRGAAFRNLGLALMNSGHIAESEAPLRAALEQQQPDLWAHCLLSEVYKQPDGSRKRRALKQIAVATRQVRKQHSEMMA